MFSDTTFICWVFPGGGTVYFKGAAVKDLLKVDLERERSMSNYSL